MRCIILEVRKFEKGSLFLCSVKKFFDVKKKFFDVKRKNVFDVKKCFGHSKKNVFDVKKVFGRQKMYWTLKNVFDVFFLTSPKFF